jgi:hypothetical protein
VAPARLGRPFGPGHVGGRGQGRQRGDGRCGVGLLAQRRTVYAADLVGIGMQVHQRLPRHRHLEQGVAVGRDVAQPRPERQDQVGVPDEFLERGVHAQAHVAHVLPAAVVQRVLAPERAGHRQVPCGREAGQVVGCLARPAAAAHHQQRLPGAGQHVTDAAHHVGRRRGGLQRGAGEGGLVGQLGQHVFRQRHDHRPRPARDGGVEGAGDDLGHARCIRDLDHPLGELAEHGVVVDLLEGFAPRLPAGDLSHEQDQGRGVLLGRVHADARVGGAGAARDHADAGPAGHLAVGLGHVGGTAFVLGHHQVDVVGCVVQGVEHLQIAFAGHAEHPVHAMEAKAVHQHPAGGTRGGGNRRGLAGGGCLNGLLHGVVVKLARATGRPCADGV